MPKLEQFEIKKYWQIFSGLKPVDNKLTHDQVQPILFNSKLDSSILNKIWFLADIDDDDNLDFEEFVICMRLIFDMVNKNIETVPDNLPDWLIPGSKLKLIQQRESRDVAPESSVSSNITVEDSAPAVAPKQPPSPPKLDWYIGPSDKSLYNSIYDSCSKLTDGTIAYGPLFSAMRSKFTSINSVDFDRLWVLVNPQNMGSINKDPAVYLIHALKQRAELGCELPAELPHAFREVCNQQRVSYDLNSSQGDITRHSRHTNTSHNADSPSQSSSEAYGSADPEVAALRKQLAVLDSESSEPEDAKAIEGSDPAVARSEFEELFHYLQKQSSSSQGATGAALDVRSINEDLETIEQQVGVLEQFLASKKQELYQLQSECQSMHA
ncbi:LAME_0D06634g1_1 [Lachancea meyersii CBS 8951]|uniref:Actin cytoskeleton-regulatory complex protein END3 n=1 Tax=Lachancea meyersii CBS 8951 TaxID=1266667 RepID=A0A1G4J9S4_9SACH|nr:LAME_0D06634g1_1 [Lachancea meyersii CBS 8951]